MTKRMVVSIVWLLSSGITCACSSAQSAQTHRFESEAAFYAALEPINQPIVSSIRAIESRPANKRLARTMLDELSDCDAWMVVRREDLQPLTYSFTTLCFGENDTVRIAASANPGDVKFNGTINRDAAELLASLERPTIVADSGLGISDGSFTFITLFANGHLYRHAIVCDDCVERSDQNEKFVLIASALRKVHDLAAEAKKE